MSNGTANEQLMLELINRARLDPLGEAARFGIDLNQGLAAGTISSAPKQPLAMNDLLIASSRSHSQWMLDADVFSHTGSGGSNAGQRMQQAGYQFTGSWTWGENISWYGSTGSINLTSYIVQQHENLFESPGHRTNILGTNFREIGVGQVQGQFTSNGRTYNTSMVTQNFGKTGNDAFITGVIYSDTDNNDFYSVGEGIAGFGVSARTNGGAPVTRASGGAGGYEIPVAQGAQDVTFGTGGSAPSIAVSTTAGNVKLDYVNGVIETSASATLGANALSARLLGVAGNALTGNALTNILTGNAGANSLAGLDGDDTLEGLQGSDVIAGGTGFDIASYAASFAAVDIRLNTGNASGGHAQGDTLTSIEGLVGSAFDDTFVGDFGNNRFEGRGGNDDVFANFGDDVILGGAGADRLYGQWGDDRIEGGAGNDLIDGGDGFDTADYTNSPAAIDIRLNANQFSGGDAQGDRLISIERVIGSQFDDKLIGGLDADWLEGGAGNDDIFANHGQDTIFGGAGADRLYGQWGDDTIEGGAGNDLIDGGDGFDFASYIGSASGVDLRMNSNSYSGGDAAGDFLLRIEGIIGSNHDDTFVSWTADDWLDGAGGNDDIYANHGNDTVFGGAGNDRIFGQWGADRIDGGAGNDQIWGGSESDVFVFKAGGGTDNIMDFVAGGGIDQIQLEGFGALDFNAILSLASQSGADTLISFATGDRIWLRGVTLSSLLPEDFLPPVA